MKASNHGLCPRDQCSFFFCFQGNIPDCLSVNHHSRAKRTALLIYVFGVTFQTIFKDTCENGRVVKGQMCLYDKDKDKRNYL